MNGPELIHSVTNRLSALRRLNLAIALVCPIIVLSLSVAAAASGLLPKPFAVPLIGAAILVALFFLEKSLTWAKRIPEAEAASLLDRKLQAKERFVTLATVTTSSKTELGPALAEVCHQSDEFAAGISPREFVRFTLYHPARISALLSPFLLAALLFLFYSIYASRAVTPHSAMAQQYVAAINSMVQSNVDLPAGLRSDLNKLADTLEEEGLLGDETLEALDDTLETVETLQTSHRQSISTVAAKGTIAKVSPGAKSGTADNQPSSAPQQADLERQDKAKEEQLPESSSAEQKQATNKQEPPTPPGKLGANPTEQNAAKPQAKPPSPAHDKPRTPEDEKKDLSGVGKGNNKPGGGNKPQQQTDDEKQKGSPGTEKDAEKGGAGSAENDRPKGGKTPQDKSDKPQTGDRGSGGSESGEGPKAEAQTSDKGTEGAQGEGKEQSNEGAVQEIDAVKKELEKLKKEIEAQAKDSPQTGKNQAEKQTTEGAPDKSPQAKNDASDKNKNGEKGAEDKAGQGTSAGKDQSNKSGNTKGQEQAAGHEGAQEQADKSGKKNEQAADNPEEKQEQGGKKGEQSVQGGKERQGKENQDAGEDSSADKADNEAKEPANETRDAVTREAQGGAKQPSAQKPTSFHDARSDLGGPDDAAQRDGNSKADENALNLDKAKMEKVEIPAEEKIVVRSLGDREAKLYRHRAGAHAKTQLGSADFKKPEAESGQTTQPIPVEYRDILR